MVDPLFPFPAMQGSLLDDTIPPGLKFAFDDGTVYDESSVPDVPGEKMTEVTDTPAEFDWSHVKAATATRLRKPKVDPVPPHIVALAQSSWDSQAVLEHDFGDTEAGVKRAAAFAKLMRKAGSHTSPMTSVSVAVDPEEEGRPGYIRWEAGKRRGRGTAQAVGA